MSGFCGWLGVEAGSDEGRATLERMGRCLTRFDDTDAEQLVSRKCAVASAPLGRRAYLARDGDRIAVLDGDPEFVDTDLAASSREQGPARALLSGYRDHGRRIVERMRGGFSLAILHAAGEEAFLAIDRVGGRFPLYYRRAPGGLLFGTTGNAIHVHPSGRSEIDPQGLFNYLYFHVVPGPRTARRDLSRLLPGTRLRFHDGQCSVERYWAPEYTDAADAPLRTLEGEFLELAERSVRDAARDARTGCFLSGGTDSSTIAGLLAGLSGAAAPTFSIGFDAERYDEMKYARIAARHFATAHHEYYLRPEDVLHLIPRVAEVFSEPFGNESVVPAYHCARMARENGIDVLLGGDGGDELFAGNERYAKQKVFEIYGRVPKQLRRWLVEPAMFGFPFGEHVWPVRKARSYIRQANIPMPDRTETYAYLERFGPENILEPDFLRTVDVAEPRRLLREAYGGARADTMLNRFLAMDLRFTIADSDLPKVSRMCELAGVGVRYPLLSDELIEFAARIPVSWKMKRLRLRWFFKHALRDFLPREILHKTKHGMGMPFGLWLRVHAPLQELVQDSLVGLKRRGIVRSDFIDQVRSKHEEEHSVYYGVLIWVFVQLEQWLRCHVDSAGPDRP